MMYSIFFLQKKEKNYLTTEKNSFSKTHKKIYNLRYHRNIYSTVDGLPFLCQFPLLLLWFSEVYSEMLAQIPFSQDKIYPAHRAPFPYH